MGKAVVKNGIGKTIVTNEKGRPLLRMKYQIPLLRVKWEKSLLANEWEKPFTVSKSIRLSPNREVFLMIINSKLGKPLSPHQNSVLAISANFNALWSPYQCCFVAVNLYFFPRHF